MEGASWQFTGFYGWAEWRHKTLSWQLLHRLSMESPLLWLVMSDFIDIMILSKKVGGAAKPNCYMEA